MQTRYIRMSNPAGEVARVKRTKNTYGQYNDEADTLGWNNSTINKLSTTYKILDAACLLLTESSVASIENNLKA